MALDPRITKIGQEKPAGSYFVVTDSKPNNNNSANSNLRLYFINSDKGPVNTVLQFQKGDIAGFESVYGSILRKKEKTGNFSIRVVEDALLADTVLVMNLRKFDDLVDLVSMSGMSTNKTIEEIVSTGYTNAFNTNGFWTINPKAIPNKLTTENLLTFANVGTSDISKFVVVAKDVSSLTSKGDETLGSTSIAIEDYPSLDKDMLFKDTFVDVYIFNNIFDPLNVSTNRYFGHLFGATGLIKYSDLQILASIPEAGFNRKITGCIIPNIKNERDEDISIDTLLNSVYPDTNLISFIDDDMLELDSLNNSPIINTQLIKYYDKTGNLIDSGSLLSHRLQTVTTQEISLDAIDESQLISYTTTDLLRYSGVVTSIFPDELKKNEVYSIYENGIRVGDRILDADMLTQFTVVSIRVVDEATTIGQVVGDVWTKTYKRVILTLSGVLSSTIEGYAYFRINDLLRNGSVKATNLPSYKPRLTQFTDGSSARQKEILDVMLSAGLIKGMKQLRGLRYIVDCFKSFPEASYKFQFGLLLKELDNSNKFVRGIINEPFLEDLEKSNNPLFKESPTDVFDIKYIATGGNTDFSTSFMSKPIEGAEMMFYFGNKMSTNGRDELPASGDISNKFVQKTYPFDVVANSTGYLDNVSGLSFNPDETERKVLENFRWNPIIKNDKGITIYGNNTGQKANTSLLQISNSELLAYVKENLYNMSLDDNFKKGTYSEFLALETSAKTFMEGIVLADAITPGSVIVTCNGENNNIETEALSIRRIYVEYHAVRSLDKTVFELKLT